MTFIDFCEKMLIALYQDGHASDEFLSFAELRDKYGLGGDVSWLSRSMNHLRSQRRVDGREIPGAPDTVVGKITGSGMAYIEGKYGGKDGVGQVLDPVSRGATLEPFFDVPDQSARDPIFDSDIFDPEIFDTGEPVDSSKWTGLPKRGVLTPEASQRLIAALKVADDALEKSNASNEEKAQAKAYIIAIHALAEAPEPPADLIWKMVERLNSIAGIAGLFLSLVGLFT